MNPGGRGRNGVILAAAVGAALSMVAGAAQIGEAKDQGPGFVPVDKRSKKAWRDKKERKIDKLKLKKVRLK